jgi:hypothetical protein
MRDLPSNDDDGGIDSEEMEEMKDDVVRLTRRQVELELSSMEGTDRT